jgi:membrane protein YdbS with pleckstrin-like domain
MRHHRYENYHFIGQQEDESILLIIHRHWFNILIQFLGIIFILLVLLASSLLLIGFSIDVTAFIDGQLLAFLFNTVILFLWIFGFFVWIDVWFDVWIITNRRVINIEQRGLFVREISELEMAKVQDVTSEVIGILPSVLNFGNVYIQTAGEQEHFEFHQVPDPSGVKDMITTIIHAREDNESIEEALSENAIKNPIK